MADGIGVNSKPISDAQITRLREQLDTTDSALWAMPRSEIEALLARLDQAEAPRTSSHEGPSALVKRAFEAAAASTDGRAARLLYELANEVRLYEVMATAKRVHVDVQAVLDPKDDGFWKAADYVQGIASMQSVRDVPHAYSRTVRGALSHYFQLLADLYSPWRNP